MILLTKKYNYIEKVVEQELKNMVNLAGGLCYKFNSDSENGVPDRIVLYKGKTHFVELKAPGEKPRADQIEVHKKMAKRNIPVYTLDTIEKVDAFVDEMIMNNGEIIYPEKYTYQPKEEQSVIVLMEIT